MADDIEVWETGTMTDELYDLRGGIIRIWDGGLRPLYFTDPGIVSHSFDHFTRECSGRPVQG